MCCGVQASLLHHALSIKIICFLLCLRLQGSYWPVFFHILCIILACLAISRGVSTIEPVNRIIVPTLLIIVVFSFYWSLSLPYAGMGIIHMFTPNWGKKQTTKQTNNTASLHHSQSSSLPPSPMSLIITIN